MSYLRISIAMCTYNGAVFLPVQLRSIATQSQLPDELIVCDDGSTDDTLAVLNAFAAQVSFPVRVFSNEERMGPAKNFEKAIGLCTGDVIVLSDQDDLWNPLKVAKLVEVFESHPEAIYAFSDAEMIGQDGALLNEKLWDAIAFRERIRGFSGAGQLKMLLKQNLVTGAAMAFRASFRDVVLPIPSGWMHDYWIVLLGSTLAQGVPIPDVLFSYRRHATQAVGWRKKTFLEVCKESLAAGQEDWGQKVENFRRLLERVTADPRSAHSSPECLRLLKQKELHLLKRANSRSSSGIPRVAKVLAEAVTGRYQRYSNSWYSIVRDL
jgi:glycosyltransferase involved in cell wall biosynthesis